MTSTKQITVSMECVIDTVKCLRQKRNEREKLVRGLINTVALVMKAVNVTVESMTKSSGFDIECTNISCDSAESLKGIHMLSSDMQNLSNKMLIASGVSEVSEDNVGGEKTQSDRPSLPSQISVKSSESISPLSALTSLQTLSKSGSPYRAQLVATGSPVVLKGMASIRSEEDLRMQFWQVNSINSLNSLNSSIYFFHLFYMIC